MSPVASSPNDAAAAALNPRGAFEYPRGSIEHAEIHRALERTDYVDTLLAGLAQSDAEARRAAQIAVLGLVRADPLELFRQLRSVRPVVHLPDLSLYLVTRDTDVRRILNEPTIFSVRDYLDRMDPVVGGYMLNQDGHPYYNAEEKPWMRTLLTAADFPRVRDCVREATTAFISEQTTGGRLEVVAALGRAVPVHLVQHYFGFAAPTDKLLDWSYRTQDSFFHNVGYLRGTRGWLVRTLGVGGPALKASQQEAQRVHEAGHAAGAEMRTFLDDYITRQRAQIMEQDTTLSRMLAVNDELASPKTHERIRSNVVGTLVGAVETSNAAIVQSLHQLMSRPDRLAEARQAAAEIKDDDPIHQSRFARYVFEALRFHPINPFVVRTIEKTTRIGDGDQSLALEAGQRVLVATHSAMHDPRAVREPTAFDIDRPEHDREMNLGYGTHRCLGDHVAKVMVPEVLRQLVGLRDLARVPEDPPIEINFGIDFGKRNSFPERYEISYTA